MATAGQPLTSDALCLGATRGDRGAREELVRAVGPLVLGMSRRMSPDPEDAFQAVWERVFKALKRFDCAGPAKLSTWVATIAHRCLIDRRRVQSRRGQVVPLPIDLAGRDQPEEHLQTKERKALLESEIDALPDELRAVVVAHHLGGLSLRDIADAEGLPTGTVKSRLHRGRAALADQLRGKL